MQGQQKKWAKFGPFSDAIMESHAFIMQYTLTYQVLLWCYLAWLSVQYKSSCDFYYSFCSSIGLIMVWRGSHMVNSMRLRSLKNLGCVISATICDQQQRNSMSGKDLLKEFQGGLSGKIFQRLHFNKFALMINSIMQCRLPNSMTSLDTIWLRFSAME